MKHRFCRTVASAAVTLDEKAGQTLYNAPAIERLGVPAYNWWNEALHGVARAGRGMETYGEDGDGLPVRTVRRGEMESPSWSFPHHGRTPRRSA